MRSGSHPWFVPGHLKARCQTSRPHPSLPPKGEGGNPTSGNLGAMPGCCPVPGWGMAGMGLERGPLSCPFPGWGMAGMGGWHAAFIVAPRPLREAWDGAGVRCNFMFRMGGATIQVRRIAWLPNASVLESTPRLAKA